jgi:hypothetical protein
MVEATPWEHKGKTLEGGYMPLMYDNELDYEKVS